MFCSSRHKTARPQDIARAVHIIKSLCYPYMARFLTNIHQMSTYFMVSVLFTCHIKGTHPVSKKIEIRPGTKE